MKRRSVFLSVLVIIFFAGQCMANPQVFHTPIKSIPGSRAANFPGSLKLARPDLKITHFTVHPQQLRLPGSFEMVAKIKNLGGPSPASTMLFTVHGDIPHDLDVQQNLTQTVPPLKALGSTTVRLRFTPVKAGNYTLGGMVDPGHRITERNEQNNVVPKVLMIQVRNGGADLDLVSLSPNHKRRHWYQKFVVTAVVKNRGNIASGPFNVHLYRLFDKPAGWAQGSRKDMVKSCSSLEPKETCTIKYTFKYKVFVGNPHVEVKVDPERRVRDYNRKNNHRKIHLTVL